MTITAEILRGCQEHDHKAQQHLYKCCFSVLMGIAMRYKKNEEDAISSLNMGFMKIIANLGKYQPHIPFEAWVRRIMINFLIDEYRKEKREKQIISQHELNFNTYNEAIDYNTADLLLDAQQLEYLITLLPEMPRQVFNLFAIDGYSHREIAEMLGISEGTSKWHLANARQRLKADIAILLEQQSHSLGKKKYDGTAKRVG